MPRTDLQTRELVRRLADLEDRFTELERKLRWFRANIHRTPVEFVVFDLPTGLPYQLRNLSDGQKLAILRLWGWGGDEQG